MMMKRRRLQKTDYNNRIKLLKSGKIRLVIRRKHNNIHVQFVSYGFNGDKTIVEDVSRNLAKHGWKMHGGSSSAAYLTGLMAGVKAKSKGVHECVVDIGLHTRGSNVLYAAAKGVLDSGVNVPIGFELDEKRVKGALVSNYAKSVKGKKTTQFAKYAKDGVAPEAIEKHFEEVKNSIMKKKEVVKSS